MDASKLSQAAQAEIRMYAQGERSAAATANVLYTRCMTMPAWPNPSASDVIQWSNQLGYGLPPGCAEESMSAVRRSIESFQLLHN